MRSKREDVGLVHVAELDQASVRRFAVIKSEAVLRENVSTVTEVRSGKAVLRQRARGRAEHLREVNHGVARNSEGEFGLSFAGALHADHNEGAGVENGGERGYPGLIVVLRAEVGEHWIAEVALHQFGG